jgi:hypothetical protein
MATTKTERVLGVLLIVMALVTTGQTAWYSHEQQNCNEAFAKNLAARSQWAAEDREALNNLIITVFTYDNDRRQVAAYRRWRHITTTNERARVAQPLPALADCE